MSHDDPRLTGYALGALDDEGAAEVEALLATDPAARAEVDSIRAAAASLSGALEAEPIVTLDPARRAAIEAAATAARPAGRVLRFRPSVGLAASVLLVGALAFATWGTMEGNVSTRDLYVADNDLHGQFMPEEARISVTRRWRFHWADPPRACPAPASTAPGKPGVRSVSGKWKAPAGILMGGALTVAVQPVKVRPRAGEGKGLEYYGLSIGAAVNQADSALPLIDPATPRPIDEPGGSPDPPDAGGATPTPPEGEALSDFDTEESSTESYDAIVENPWIRPVGEAALSTFSIDVDTAAYAILRRCLVQENRLPPRGLARIEEMVNYFRYRYDGPTGAEPFAVRADAAACPWEPRHRLVRIALKARDVEKAQRPAANLVFLVDVSGSMGEPNKLPLVQQSIALLVPDLGAQDRISLVAYAGASGLVLPATPGDRHEEILAAIQRLQAGGSTNGGAGIELAYKVATENFVPGGINRVLLATDGDFNVGVTNQSDLVDLITKEAKSRVFLTTLGYGMGNLKDSTLESLADKGNGNYGYVDSLAEARKVLVEEGMSTLQTVAKDVKIQVEWNPAKVAGYRLLGYENRILAAQDFLDDTKDAGEMGAGHTVTALYEVVPAGEAVPGAAVEGLRYQQPAQHTGSDELLTVKCRYKDPEGDVSRGFEVPCSDSGLAFDAAAEDFRFAAAVAAFGLVLRDSTNKGSASLQMVTEIAASSLGTDEGGYRKEFVSLVEKALALKK